MWTYSGVMALLLFLRHLLDGVYYRTDNQVENVNIGKINPQISVKPIIGM